jgi:hypothetical protein
MLQEKPAGDPRPAMDLFNIHPARFSEGIIKQLAPQTG